MALLLGFFFACIFALLVFLPFGWFGMRIMKKLAKKKEEKSVTWLDAFATLAVIGIGIYLAIQVFNYTMGGLIDSLNP